VPGALARADSTILHEATGAAGDIAPWQRYPEGEVYDPQTHCQYFYHSHGAPEPAGNSEPPSTAISTCSCVPMAFPPE
jgi:hypothetical protein